MFHIQFLQTSGVMLLYRSKVCNKGVIVGVAKIGALFDYNNWRRITLLSIQAK